MILQYFKLGAEHHSAFITQETFILFKYHSVKTPLYWCINTAELDAVGSLFPAEM